MREDIPAFCAVLDKRVEETIALINTGDYGIMSTRIKDTSYPNIAISSATIYDTYLEIRKVEEKNIASPNRMFILDVGCGIGNAAELYASLAQNDHKAFPGLKTVHVTAIDNVEPFLNQADKALKAITDFVLVAKVDLETQFDRFQEVLKEFVRKIDVNIDSKGTPLPIIYCNRPFRDDKMSDTLERYLVENASVGTYLHFPMGMVSRPQTGVVVKSKFLIIKTEKNVGY